MRTSRNNSLNLFCQVSVHERKNKGYNKKNFSPMKKQITRLVFHTSVLTILFALPFTPTSAQQVIQLYYEDFNGGTPGFTLNTATNVSAATGPNQWIINS